MFYKYSTRLRTIFQYYGVYWYFNSTIWRDYFRSSRQSETNVVKKGVQNCRVGVLFNVEDIPCPLLLHPVYRLQIPESDMIYSPTEDGTEYVSWLFWSSQTYGPYRRRSYPDILSCFYVLTPKKGSSLHYPSHTRVIESSKSRNSFPTKNRMDCTSRLPCLYRSVISVVL